MIRCSIVGVTGYTGLELARILLRHPDVSLSYLVSSSEEKRVPIQQYLPDVSPEETICVAKCSPEEVVAGSDVVFLALPHTVAMNEIEQYLTKDTVVIDLSADFRLTKANYEKWYETKHEASHLLKKAVYSIPELHADKIMSAQLISNPGCFPTSIILGLAPLLANKLIKPGSIIIDSKTGVSGAGKKPSSANHFGEVHENFKAYKVNRHQHSAEIGEQLQSFSAKPVSFTFVPHLLPVSRGILSTMYLDIVKGVTANDVRDAYNEFYSGKIFIRMKEDGVFPQLKDVAYTNFCDIGFTLDAKKSRLIVISAIDNLVKGASGQAVQNMNVRCGFAEECGFFRPVQGDVKIKPELPRKKKRS